MILNLSKERDLVIELNNEKGKFKFEGTINTKMLDVYIQAEEEMTNNLQSIKIANDYQEIPVKDFAKQQKKTTMKLIEAFFGDKYVEFINFIGGENSTFILSQVGQEITENISKLGEEMLNNHEEGK